MVGLIGLILQSEYNLNRKVDYIYNYEYLVMPYGLPNAPIAPQDIRQMGDLKIKINSLMRINMDSSLKMVHLQYIDWYFLALVQ